MSANNHASCFRREQKAQTRHPNRIYLCGIVMAFRKRRFDTRIGLQRKLLAVSIRRGEHRKGVDGLRRCGRKRRVSHGQTDRVQYAIDGQGRAVLVAAWNRDGSVHSAGNIDRKRFAKVNDSNLHRVAIGVCRRSEPNLIGSKREKAEYR